MTDLELPTARALAVADAYDRLNLVQRGRTWTTEELALGFTGDVGDLAKLVRPTQGPVTSPAIATSSVTSSRTACGPCW